MTSEVKKGLVAVGTVEQLEQKGKIVAKLDDGVELAVFKKSDGSLAAVENYCPHKGGPLALGALKGDSVVCPWHGFRFNVSTGACSDMQSVMRARAFPATVKEEIVYIER